MQGTFNTSDFDRINTGNEDNTHPYGEDEEEIIYGDDTDTTTDEEADEFEREFNNLENDMTTDEEAAEFEQESRNLEREQWERLRQNVSKAAGPQKTTVRVAAKRKNAKGQKFNVAIARKNALLKGMAPRAEGICPVCHKRSIFKSYRPMDLALFTGLVALVTAGSSRVSTFYCMNRKCRVSYWKNFCFRCAGDRWVGGKVPWKRIAGVDM